MKNWIVITLLIGVACCICTPASAWDTTGLMKEWAGDASMNPYDIATLPDGSVWMTHENATTGALIKLDYPTGTLHMIPAPFSVHFWTLDTAPDGTLWITDESGSLVQFFPSESRFESHPIDARFPASPNPYGVSVADDGKVWFTCQSDPPCIGVYDPSSGSWQRYDLPDGGDYDAGVPVEIDFESDGTVWFTIRQTDSHTGNGGIGRLDPVSGECEIWTDPAVFFDGALPPLGGLRGPWGIIVTGHDPARVWFVDKISALLVRFDEGEPPEVTWYYLLPEDFIDSHFIAQDPDGKIWLASMGQNHIGVFDPVTETISSFDPRSGRNPICITISPLGEVWWSETGYRDAGIGTGRFIPFTDSDRDGIDDRIDTSPHRSSKDFFDKATKTGGTITERGGQALTLTKASTPYGVRVMSGPLTIGRDPAVITAKCPGLLTPLKSTVTVTANDDFIMTCRRPLLVLRGTVGVFGRPAFPALRGLFG